MRFVIDKVEKTSLYLCCGR